MSLHDMAGERFEQWSPTAFLAAGGLFAFPAAAFGVEAATGVGAGVPPAVVYLCLLVGFVGLFGLYPGLAEEDATVARGGVGLLAATTAVLVPALGVSLLPLGLTLGKATVMAVIVTIVVGAILTVTAFGVGSLRTGAHARLVGGFLLVAGAAMTLILVAMLRGGHTAPAWVSAVGNGLVAVSFGASGYTLRAADGAADETTAAGELAAA